MNDRSPICVLSKLVVGVADMVTRLSLLPCLYCSHPYYCEWC